MLSTREQESERGEIKLLLKFAFKLIEIYALYTFTDDYMEGLEKVQLRHPEKVFLLQKLFLNFLQLKGIYS